MDTATDAEPAQPSRTAAAASSPPSSFVITHSVSKRHNIGTIARCATAFGVKELCLVGSRQFNTFGSHGSDVYVALRHFNTLEQCVQHLREAEACEVVGVEIVEGARPVQDHPFKGPTAFMLGNEGQGLSPKQMSLCDRFVYIPQYGAGTASLNVAVASSIVLHHFAIWAGYQERQRDGFKFVVAERPQRVHARGLVQGGGDEIRLERQQQREALREEGDAAAQWQGGLFEEGEVADDEAGGFEMCGVVDGSGDGSGAVPHEGEVCR